MFNLLFTNNKNNVEQPNNIPELEETDDFFIDEETWDIGEKGGEVNVDEDWGSSDDYMRQFLDNGFGDIPPKGYTPESDDST